VEHPTSELTERERRVLSLTVLCHISSGEPVGSRFVAKRLDLDLSPATIRNTMADLEEKGFLRQTHVSSGRIPTDLGYRFYVDDLVGAGTGRPACLEGIRERFSQRRFEINELVRETSKVLSSVSRHAGLVLGPQFLNSRCQHLEFRRVGERKVLAIFVAERHLVQTRVLDLDEDWSQEDLNAMSRLWNERFAALTIREVRSRLRELVSAEKAEFDRLMEQALELGRQALAAAGESEDLYVDGAANILDVPEFSHPDKMRALMRAIEEKGRLCRLLDECLRAGGVQVYIGGELSFPGLEDLSLVTAPYGRDNQVLGVLGIIGPTRMSYERIIPIVEYTASSLSECLSRD
jgi:heat-inducible transcriptional repressor